MTASHAVQAEQAKQANQNNQNKQYISNPSNDWLGLVVGLVSL
jgi:hypothetical protein